MPSDSELVLTQQAVLGLRIRCASGGLGLLLRQSSRASSHRWMQEIRVSLYILFWKAL